MKRKAKLDNLFEDQGDDPLWQEAMWRAWEEEMGLPDGLDRGWVGCSLAWGEWVYPRIENQVQLWIMLLLHRKRLVTGSRVVSLTNAELERFGISRQAKYRALARLELAGLLIIQPWKAGKPTEVTLSNPPYSA